MATISEIVDIKTKEYGAQLNVAQTWAATLVEVLGRIVDELNNVDRKHTGKLSLGFREVEVTAKDSNSPSVAAYFDITKTQAGCWGRTKQERVGTLYARSEGTYPVNEDASLTGQARPPMLMKEALRLKVLEGEALWRFIREHRDADVGKFQASASGANLGEAAANFRNAICTAIALGNLKTLVS